MLPTLYASTLTVRPNHEAMITVIGADSAYALGVALAVRLVIWPYQCRYIHCGPNQGKQGP